MYCTIHMCIYVYIYIHTYIHIYICIYIYTVMPLCICIVYTFKYTNKHDYAMMMIIIITIITITAIIVIYVEMYGCILRYTCTHFILCQNIHVYVYIINIYTTIGDRALKKHIMRYPKYYLLSDKAVQISPAPAEQEQSRLTRWTET